MAEHTLHSRLNYILFWIQSIALHLCIMREVENNFLHEFMQTFVFLQNKRWVRVTASKLGVACENLNSHNERDVCVFRIFICVPSADFVRHDSWSTDIFLSKWKYFVEYASVSSVCCAASSSNPGLSGPLTQIMAAGSALPAAHSQSATFTRKFNFQPSWIQKCPPVMNFPAGNEAV